VLDRPDEYILQRRIYSSATNIFFSDEYILQRRIYSSPAEGPALMDMPIREVIEERMEHDDAEWAAFPERLRQARVRCGLSQSCLSLRAGLHRTACQKLEAGIMPTIATVGRLARVLGVPPGWLAFGGAQEAHDLPSPPVEWRPSPIHGTSPAGPAGRPMATRHLPTLGPAYQPVILALGPGLPHDRRKQAASWLVDAALGTDVERAMAAGLLEMLLRPLVPAEQQALLEQVLRDLRQQDPVARATPALALLVDADLPLPAYKLERALDQGTVPPGLVGAVEEALEIWDLRTQLTDQNDRRWMDGLEVLSEP
jgi:transcriptional regulator with XRE-family HTH domain